MGSLTLTSSPRPSLLRRLLMLPSAAIPIILLVATAVIQPCSSFVVDRSPRRRHIVVGPSPSALAVSSSATTSTSTSSSSTAAATNKATSNNDKSSSSPSASSSRAWFPTRPSDALPTEYDSVVRGAYVRHVLVETEEMADLALATYLSGGRAGNKVVDEDGKNDGVADPLVDPFGELARDLSACAVSRGEGGKVGWVDNPAYHRRRKMSANAADTDCDADEQQQQLNEAIHPILPSDVISRLFQSRPKGGDVLKVPSDSDGTWHLLRVDDIMVDYVPNSDDDANGRSKNEGESEDESEDKDSRFAQKGTNKVIKAASRSKLKGLGTTPVAPRIVPSTASAGNDINEIDESDDGDDGSVPVAKTYHIATTGCQMNVADSERLAGVLEHDLNLKPVGAASDSAKAKGGKGKSASSSKEGKAEEADVVILNTCTIRDHAEQKVYDALGPHAARKRRGERVAIVVAGCVAQQEGEALLRRVPEIDLVMGPQYAGRLGDLLEGVGRGHQIVATDPTLITEDLSRPVRGHAVRGWVNVIHGCNEHCTYCVVPGVRGVEQSRSMEGILQECVDLAQGGYKEVTLLGQNIDAYGRDMMPKRTFAELLHYLNDNIPEGTIERIRYVTSHPRYFSDRVIDAVATLDKVCECFHMPFQAGDDAVLRRMRRGYTFDSYMRIIDKIKARAPDASICGDVIVGFPGETEAAFQRTLDLMNEVKYDNLNTFAYSPRPNTEAALWDDQVPDDVKAERLQIVQRLATQHALERSERYVGRTAVPVLVEERNPRHLGQVMGRTRQGRQVFFEGDVDELMGTTVNVDIVEARPWSLTGRISDK